MQLDQVSHESVAFHQDQLCILSCCMLLENPAVILCCCRAYALSRWTSHLICQIAQSYPCQPVVAGSDLSGLCYPSVWASWLIPRHIVYATHSVAEIQSALDSRTECMHPLCGTVQTCQGLSCQCTMPCCRSHLHRRVCCLHEPRGSGLLPQAPGVLDTGRS